MAFLLESSTEIQEEVQRIGRYSLIEGEILVLLSRPACGPMAIKEIRNELILLFSQHEIWKGIFDLLQDGMIRATYTSGYEIGLEWA